MKKSKAKKPKKCGKSQQVKNDIIVDIGIDIDDNIDKKVVREIEPEGDYQPLFKALHKQYPIESRYR